MQLPWAESGNSDSAFSASMPVSLLPTDYRDGPYSLETLHSICSTRIGHKELETWCASMRG